MTRILLFASLVALSIPSSSSADVCDPLPWYYCEETIVDNLNTPIFNTVQIGSGSTSAFPNRGTGQSFRMTQGGRLSQIRVRMKRIGIPHENLSLKLYNIGEFGQIEDDVIAEVELLRWFVSSSSDYHPVEFSFQNQEVYLDTGKDYYFSIFAIDGAFNYQFELPYDDGSNYSEGTRYSAWRDNPNWAFQTSGDLNFQILATVPEPSSFLVLPVAAIGLLFRRKR